MCTDFLPPGITSCSGMDTCLYATLYHEDEDEYSFGCLIQDQLNLTLNLFPEFTFLCTQNNSKRMFPNNASGILGLGKDTNASFLSQTQGAYGWKFSYCLPHLKDSVGFLTLGSTTNDDGVKFTPLVANNTSLYIVKITSITIGGNKTFLPILSHTLEVVVDTGLKYTRLPPDVYDALNANFTDRMKNEMKYNSSINYTSDDGLLMTCFDITGKEAINAPNVRFTFEGNVTVGLDIFNLLDVVETNRTACLAFVRNNHTTDAVVFGTTQQKTREVVYDLPNNRLGFRTIKACA